MLNGQTFIRDTGTNSVMLFAFDVADGKDEAMESFRSDYTENRSPQHDCESRSTYAAEVESFHSMFLLLGGA